MNRMMGIGMLAVAASLCQAQDNGSVAMKEEAVPEKYVAVTELYNRSVADQEAGRFDDAMAGFQKVLAGARAGADADERRIFSGAANNAGNLSLLRGNLGRSEFYFRQAVEWDPENALAWNNLGAALLKQGRIPDAQTAFERSVRANPMLAMPVNNLARLLLEAGNLKMAAEYLIVSLRINPGDTETLFLLARLYNQAGMPEKQERIWQALVDVSGDSPENRLMLATHYVQEGVLDKAEEEIQAILQARPDFPEARLQLGRLRGLQGRWGEAEILLKDLLKAFPSDPAVRNDLAAALVERGRVQEAVALAEEGTARFPALAENWYILALCYDKAGNLAGNEKALRKCVELKPAYARAWNDIGVNAVRRNDKQGALDALSKALAADPYLTQAQYNLGRFLVMTEIDFDRGLRLIAHVADGNSPLAVHAIKFMDDLALIGQGKDPGWGKQ